MDCSSEDKGCDPEVLASAPPERGAEFETGGECRGPNLLLSSSRTPLSTVSARVRTSFSSLCRDTKRSVLHHARLLSLADSDLSSCVRFFLFVSQLHSLNMSSWSGSGYPPPRGRSRSRSPYRSGYPPPRSEPGYPPPESYRSEWDAYERERAWAQYDRERAGFDYGRRGRSRSPPPPDEGTYSAFLRVMSSNAILVASKVVNVVGPSRRGSATAMTRVRGLETTMVRLLVSSLLCVAHYWSSDTHSRGYGYTSPSHRGPFPPPPPYSSSRRAPPDPHTFDYPATLKQYAEWFRYYYPQQASEEDNADKAAEQEAGDGSKPRNGIRARWEKYKKDFAAQQVSVTSIHPNFFSTSLVTYRSVDVSYLCCASLRATHS